MERLRWERGQSQKLNTREPKVFSKSLKFLWCFIVGKLFWRRKDFVSTCLFRNFYRGKWKKKATSFMIVLLSVWTTFCATKFCKASRWITNNAESFSIWATLPRSFGFCEARKSCNSKARSYVCSYLSASSMHCLKTKKITT